MFNFASESVRKKEGMFTYISILIITLGIGVRLFHYFGSRSLWMDEIYLTSSLLKMNYGELATQTLDYQQKAPLFFLWSTKFFVNLLGNGEMSLRIFPLICGILSIILFSKVCSAYVSGWSKMLALAIFSFSPAIVYHSVEIKQYATECLGTVMSMYLFILFKDQVLFYKKLLWGIFGGIVIWFSFSSIFILAGIGLAISVQALFTKNFQRFQSNIITFCIWLASFALNYLIFIQRHAQSDWVIYWFKVYDNFMPFPPKSIHELKWFMRNFIAVFDYPLGLTWFPEMIENDILTKFLLFPFVPVLLLVLGVQHMIIKQPQLYYASVVALLLTLISSGFNMYPLVERFWLFLAPIFILTIGFGLDYLILKTKSNKVHVLAILILIGPVLQTAYYLIRNEQFYKHKKSFEKEMLSLINKNCYDGDVVYNYWNNNPGLKVYTKINSYRFTVVYGKDFRQKSQNLAQYNQYLNKDFQKIKHRRRVWVVYNTQFLTDIGDKIDDPQWYYQDMYSPIRNLIREFNKLGKPVYKKKFKDVECYLFYLD